MRVYSNACLHIYFFSAAVSLLSKAGSAIAVLQVIIASPTVCLVTVIKEESQLRCATLTQEGVSAR